MQKLCRVAFLNNRASRLEHACPPGPSQREPSSSKVCQLDPRVLSQLFVYIGKRKRYRLHCARHPTCSIFPIF